MNRSGRWRNRRRNGSRPTAPTEPWPPLRTSGGTGTALLLPDGSSQLSDGVVVETRLLARLFGVRILRVEGTILLSPGRLIRSAGTRPLHTDDTAQIGDGLERAAVLLDESHTTLRGAERSRK